ncbi:MULTISPECIES: hypothetical protein [Falsihalocynthiibacter]|uniref:hypothetical protein n=1 Tax=Falsihalocynthiibacter TaxID=2854182 RepID=UPI0030011F49
MKRIVQIVLLLLVSFPAYSQTIIARSGEHENFSRIVLPFQNAVTWEMGRFDGGYIVRFETPIDEIDFSNVYRLIPRTRISDLEFASQKNEIRLFVNCTCHANAFDFKEGKLVLDVLDGQPISGSLFENALRSIEDEGPDDRTVIAAQPIIRLLDTNAPLQEKKDNDVSKSEIDKAKNHALDFALKPLPASERGVSLLFDTFPRLLNEPANTAIAEISSGKITGMESRLANQIGRASTQGLLEPNLLERPTFPPQPIILNEPLASGSVGPTAEVPNRKAPHIRIQATTSIDQGVIDAFANSGPLRTNGLKNECLPKEAFSVENWGTEGAIFSGISNARIRLFSEFDAASNEAAESLAMAYIYATFGSEAMQVIRTQSTQLSNHNLLFEIAWTLEYGSGIQEGVLSEQLNCATAGAMWAILSGNEIPKNHSINLPFVKKSFSELPLHLRRYLGPRLVEKFLQASDRKTAVEIRNAVSRAEGQHGDEFTLADAKLEISQGYSIKAIDSLSTIAGGGSETSIEALLEIVQNEILNKKPILKSRILELEALTFELRGTEIEAKIIPTLVAAIVKNNSLQKAWDILAASSETNVLTPEISLSLFSQTLIGAYENMDTAKFLEFVYTNEELIVALDLSRSLKQRLAKRLVDNGLSSFPVKILGIQEQDEEGDALIFAAAANNRNEPHMAVELTANYPNNETATRIRIRAAVLLKDNKLRAFEEAKLGNDDAAIEAQWRGRDLAAISRQSSSDLSAAATLLDVQDKTSVENKVEDIKLASLRGKLNEIRNVRRVATELLVKFGGPLGDN